MGRLGDALGKRKVKKGPVCAVANLLRLLPDEDAKDLEKWLRDPAYPATLISEELRGLETDDKGGALFDIGADSLRRHRRRLLGRGDGCGCLA